VAAETKKFTEGVTEGNGGEVEDVVRIRARGGAGCISHRYDLDFNASAVVECRGEAAARARLAIAECPGEFEDADAPSATKAK
jgi:hypothetical protein